MEEREPEIVLAAKRTRLNFAKKYCKKKGWTTNVRELSSRQISEIRNQDGWMFPDYN